MNKTIYDFLKTEITAVSNGKQTSTIFQLGDENGFIKWTNEELGVSSIIANGTMSESAKAARDAKMSEILDFRRVLDCLLADCSYELFWYDKVAGATFSFNTSYSSTEMVIKNFTFRFTVSSDYAAGANVVNSAKISTAINASKTAKEIVSKYASKSDVEKLNAYRKEICALAEYNHSAANSTTRTYGDPWQMTSVFDGMSSTNPVCEGYAKAFQYLCDNSNFSGNVSCYLVSGYMQGGTGAGNHMWNVVQINGTTYLVDITNCDDGTIGAPDLLFLKSGTKNGNTYAIKAGSNTIYYVYDQGQYDLYTDGYLELDTTGKQPFGDSACSHKWSAGKVTKAPTCKATGVKTYTCSVCTGTKTETIAKIAHDYKAATCTAPKTCKVCKVTSGGAKGHSYKTTTTKATLTKNGSVVKKCTVCSKVASTTAIRYVKTVKLSATSYVYNGKVKTPTVTVKDSAGKTLKKGTDYDVTYASGRKNAGTYKVTIKFKGNYSGTKTLTFKINPKATISTQPKTQKVEAGEKVKFTVEATGAGLKYQWQYSANGKTWKNCSGSAAKKATFSFTGKTRHDGNYYRCKVTDSAGNVVYTKAVRAYVLGIEKQPVKKTVTKNKTAKFTVDASGNGLKYQWQYSTDGGKTWKTCSGTAAQKAAFSFKAKASQNGYYYRCKITDSAKNVVYTSKVKLTVKK